jgi:hypothetical protein
VGKEEAGEMNNKNSRIQRRKREGDGEEETGDV